mgnify:CR=1 FL=1
MIPKTYESAPPHRVPKPVETSASQTDPENPGLEEIGVSTGAESKRKKSSLSERLRQQSGERVSKILAEMARR